MFRKLLFGGDYPRWWYRTMSKANKNYGTVMMQMWQEKLGWQGWGTKEEEKALRKWAKDVLGVPWTTRLFHKLVIGPFIGFSGGKRV
jgi:hypothetical protein